jgi:hypothetical protein
LLEKLKTTGAGAVLGGLAGGLLAIPSAGATAAGRGLSNIYRAYKGKPLVTVVPRLLNELHHEIPRAARWGAATGAVAGALTDRLPSDEGQETPTYPPQSDRVVL